MAHRQLFHNESWLIFVCFFDINNKIWLGWVLHLLLLLLELCTCFMIWCTLPVWLFTLISSLVSFPQPSLSSFWSPWRMFVPVCAIYTCIFIYTYIYYSYIECRSLSISFCLPSALHTLRKHVHIINLQLLLKYLLTKSSFYLCSHFIHPSYQPYYYYYYSYYCFIWWQYYGCWALLKDAL